MKKLIIKIKSWFHRESEVDRLYRVARYLLKKYGYDPDEDYVSCSVNKAKHRSGSMVRSYNIYTEKHGHTHNTGINNTFDICVEDFELRLKKLKVDQKNTANTF